jgi:hypothetical protein
MSDEMEIVPAHIAWALGAIFATLFLAFIVLTMRSHEQWLMHMQRECEARGLVRHYLGGKSVYACQDEKTGQIYSR